MKKRRSTISKRYQNDLYSFGGNREKAIQRDGEKCVKCGMTREEHKIKYGVDITVDHIDGNGKNTPKEKKNNDMSNLMTLCKKCHGKKDCLRSPIISGKKKVVQKNFDGVTVQIWDSLRQIQRQTGHSYANIMACCKGRNKTAMGFKWEYFSKPNSVPKE
jgi:5-methylcytosine-specific restriction endonuclease McrA